MMLRNPCLNVIVDRLERLVHGNVVMPGVEQIPADLEDFRLINHPVEYEIQLEVS